MARRLFGWLLVVLGVFGSSLGAMSVGMAVTDDDPLTGVVGFAIFALITLVCLGGGWLLLRRPRTRRVPSLGWESGPGEGWLPQQAWQELPDVLPRLPRLGPAPPVPSAGVPPEARLRRLWLLRAELAFDQSGGMRSRGFAGWAVALGLLLTPTFLVGAMLATPGYFTLPDRAALGTIMAWLTAATLISGERWSRNPRRHFALRRMQRRLEPIAHPAPPPRFEGAP